MTNKLWLVAFIRFITKHKTVGLKKKKYTTETNPTEPITHSLISKLTNLISFEGGTG